MHIAWRTINVATEHAHLLSAISRFYRRELRLDFMLFLVKLQREAFTGCVTVYHAGVEMELQRQTGPMPQWTHGSAGSRLRTVSPAELHRQQAGQGRQL